MTRNKASAKQAGARFARVIADYFRAHGHPYADKQPLTGSLDKGDVANVHHPDGRPVTLELKDRATIALPQWWREAQTEAHNLGTPYAAVILKRRGTTDPAQQWVEDDDDTNRTMLATTDSQASLGDTIVTRLGHRAGRRWGKPPRLKINPAHGIPTAGFFYLTGRHDLTGQWWETNI